MEYIWQGQVVRGKICSTYVNMTGTKHFIQLTETPKVTYYRGGQKWPLEGCVVLVDAV